MQAWLQGRVHFPSCFGLICGPAVGSGLDPDHHSGLGLQMVRNFTVLRQISTVYCDPRSQRLGIVNKSEIDVFLELSCFFDDPANVDNLISGSDTFSKTSLNIWKFTVHVFLKPGLENFKHYFTSV